MPDLNLEPADFIRAAKGEDTQIMLTLTNVYQRMLLLPEGDTRDRMAQVLGYLRNEIALLSGYSQKDTDEAFGAIVAKEPQAMRVERERAKGKQSSDELSSLAAKYLARDDEDWTFVDPEDVKKLAASVLSQSGEA